MNSTEVAAFRSQAARKPQTGQRLPGNWNMKRTSGPDSLSGPSRCGLLWFEGNVSFLICPFTFFLFSESLGTFSDTEFLNIWDFSHILRSWNVLGRWPLALSVTRELGWSVSSPSASPKFWGCSSFFFNWFSHFPAGAHSLSRVLGFPGYMDPSTSCSHSWHERRSGPGSLLDTTSMISFAPNR